MPGTDQLLSYFFLGLAAFLFIMIFWNVLGGPRKQRRKRAPRQSWQETSDSTGGADASPMLGRSGRRRNGDDSGGGGDGHGHGDDGGGDGGGGDGGGGGNGGGGGGD